MAQLLLRFCKNSLKKISFCFDRGQTVRGGCGRTSILTSRRHVLVAAEAPSGDLPRHQLAARVLQREALGRQPARVGFCIQEWLNLATMSNPLPSECQLHRNRPGFRSEAARLPFCSLPRSEPDDCGVMSSYELGSGRAGGTPSLGTKWGSGSDRSPMCP